MNQKHIILIFNNNMRNNPKIKQYIILGLLVAIIPMILGIMINQTMNDQNIPEEIQNKPNPDWSDTEISIISIETDNDSITVTVSINGPADHWRIILDDEFPIGEANSIEGQGIATCKSTIEEPFSKRHKALLQMSNNRCNARNQIEDDNMDLLLIVRMWVWFC